MSPRIQGDGGRLSERQRETLDTLRCFCGDHDGPFARPMDVGGRNGSHHSTTLAQLSAKGLAERKGGTAYRTRPAWKYRITKAGIALLSASQAGGGK